MITTIFNINVVAATEYKKGKINSSSGSTKIYSLAGTTGHEANAADKNKSVVLCTLTNGTEIRIWGEELDGDGDMWYKITYGNNFENTGYAFNTRVSIIYDYTFDEDFETNLENFPESYRDALRSLHAKYPNWEFVAHNIDLSYSEVVEAQYGVDNIADTRKWVEFTYGGNEWRDMRGFDEKTGKWITLEVRWTYASREAIEYFMDPRNSLDENKIFVFMLQSYNNDTHSKEDLRAVIKNTFLEKGYDNNGDGVIDADAYIDDILLAAESSGVSPYVLAATIIVEQGVNGNTNMISGNYAPYEGYYNFFNYAAYGSTTTEISNSALAYAKSKGWNSRTASIVGGAHIFVDGYITVGQDTYYYKDFNVVNQIWAHQYAASLYDAWTNASFLRKGCVNNLDAPLVFTIPVYNEMPATACPVPTLKPSNPEPDNLIGDANSDYIVNNKDLGLLMQYLNGWDITISLNNADINADGNVNNKDYGLLMQHLNGWDITF